MKAENFIELIEQKRFDKISKDGMILIAERFRELQKKQLIITDVVASLPSKEEIYSMAKVIVDKQQKVLTIPNKEAIDWDDLTDDWFDWLEETLIG